MAKKILVVDDSEFVRNYHACIFQQAGWEVLTAVDGADGLEKLYMTCCNAIVTDINMQGMDGYEFIRRIRKEREWRDLPILIVSTESESRDKMRGFEAGANLYIVKPSSPQAMVETITMLLTGN